MHSAATDCEISSIYAVLCAVLCGFWQRNPRVRSIVTPDCDCANRRFTHMNPAFSAISHRRLLSVVTYHWPHKPEWVSRAGPGPRCDRNTARQNRLRQSGRCPHLLSIPENRDTPAEGVMEKRLASTARPGGCLCHGLWSQFSSSSSQGQRKHRSQHLLNNWAQFHPYPALCLGGSPALGPDFLCAV